MFAERMERLCVRLAEADVDVALITEDDSVYYFTGFYDYLHMEFGRPTILAVSRGWRKIVDYPFHGNGYGRSGGGCGSG